MASGKGKDLADRLAELPRRALVAFAARCARRVQPLTDALPEDSRADIAQAIAVAEAYASGDAGAAWDAAAWAARAAGAAARAVRAAAEAAGAAAEAAGAAARAAGAAWDAAA